MVKVRFQTIPSQWIPSVGNGEWIVLSLSLTWTLPYETQNVPA
jgi:hypothetical protein